MALTTKWITKAGMEARITEQKLKELTGDTPPATYNETNLDACGLDAEAKVKTQLAQRYPTQVAAGTASATMVLYCSVVCERYLYRRRAWHIPPELNSEYLDVQKELRDIQAGSAAIAEWSSSSPIESAKMEFQAIAEVYEGPFDEQLIPDEHGSDER